MNFKKTFNFISIIIITIYFYSCSTSKIYSTQDSFISKTKYVEYLPGTLPIVISVPHGGDLMPESIPNRKCDGCVYERDTGTQELARTIRDQFFKETGEYPHVVINLLNRKKFDANRDKADAADGNKIVEIAWDEYHGFLDDAKKQIKKKYKRGLFLDLHGHGHKNKRLELGYLLTKEDLQLSDSELNKEIYTNKSSIKTLVKKNKQNLTHSELLNGTTSLGSLFMNNGVPAVPSTEDRNPIDDEKYFTGGYNTERHNSLDGGVIDGIQIECHSGVRFEADKREEFASKFVITLNKYLELNYDNE